METAKLRWIIFLYLKQIRNVIKQIKYVPVLKHLICKQAAHTLRHLPRAFCSLRLTVSHAFSQALSRTIHLFWHDVIAHTAPGPPEDWPHTSPPHTCGGRCVVCPAPCCWPYPHPPTPPPPRTPITSLSLISMPGKLSHRYSFLSPPLPPQGIKPANGQLSKSLGAFC